MLISLVLLNYMSYKLLHVTLLNSIFYLYKVLTLVTNYIKDKSF